ncbi:MAG: hypothetical protein R3D32_05055 [Nitratireductor sp.]
MSEFNLVAKTGFGLDQAVHEAWQDFSVSELANLAVCWISCSSADRAGLDKAWQKLTGDELPAKGRFSDCKAGKSEISIFDAGAGQWFVTGAEPAALGSVGDAACITGQTGGWIAIRLEGSKCLTVLEKLCTIDLHPSVFSNGCCARTPFEGMGALLACDDAAAGKYRILLQRSSSRSFLDHVRHAAQSSCAALPAAG